MACSNDFYLNENENIVAGCDFKPVEEDKAMECPICMLLLRQTMGSPCSHLFCLVCLQKLTGRRDIRGTTFKCPVCNIVVETNQVFPSFYMDRCVRGSNVYCQQHKEGCGWKGTLAEYFNKHENECDFKIVPCKYERCEVSEMRRKIMKDHELHCPFRIVQCKHCTTEVRENELEKHRQSCEKFPTKCTENGCIVIVPKNEMEDHLSICGFVNVHCPYMHFGCTEKIARKNVEKHLEVHTQRHMMFICEKYQNMEEILHNTTKQIEMQRAKIEKQSIEIQKQRAEVKKQNTEIQKQKAEVNKQNTEIQKQEAEVKKQNTEIQKQKAEVKKQNTEIQKQNTEIENLKIVNENSVAKIEELGTKNVSLQTEVEKLKTDIAKHINIESQSKDIQQLKRKTVDINELLVKGADRWIRKKEIYLEENDYAVWFQKFFDLMTQNKLYRYDHVVYVKVNTDRRSTVYWVSNSKKHQQRTRHSCVIYNGVDGLLLLADPNTFFIETETLNDFSHKNSSCFIIHPRQQPKKMEYDFSCDKYDSWKIDNIPDDFYMNNFLIVCLIKN